MTGAAISTKVHQTLDVELDVTTKIALDAEVAFDRVADFTNVVVVEVVGALVRGDVRLLEHNVRRVATETENVGESDLDAFATRKVDASDTRHG